MAEDAHSNSICSNFARIVREERKRRDVSMTRLAEMAGLSQGTISLIEHEHRSPSLDTMLRIADSLGLDLSSMIARAERQARHGAKLAGKRKS